MAQTPPPSLTPTPTPAIQRGDRATFSSRLDAMVLWWVNATTEWGNLATNVYNNAVDAFNNAVAAAASASTATTQATNASTSANAAAATANAVLWVSGTSYTAYTSNVISPANGKTYRRLITGAGTTDPSLDATNWVSLSGDIPGLKLLATLTPTAAANVDALTVFTSTYDDYVIYGDGLLPSADDSVRVRFAVAGTVDSGSNYIGVNFSSSSSTTTTSLAASSTVLAAGKGANFKIEVQNVNSTTQPKTTTIMALCQNNATPAYVSTNQMGVHTPNNAITGIRFFWNSGANFVAQGSIRIYGVLK